MPKTVPDGATYIVTPWFTLLFVNSIEERDLIGATIPVYGISNMNSLYSHQ
jgi:hypothetical protein